MSTMAEVQTPELEEALERFRSIRMNLEDECNRLRGTADRLHGPEPQEDSCKSEGSTPEAYIERMQVEAQALNTVAMEIAESRARLESAI